MKDLNPATKGSDPAELGRLGSEIALRALESTEGRGPYGLGTVPDLILNLEIKNKCSWVRIVRIVQLCVA